MVFWPYWKSCLRLRHQKSHFNKIRMSKMKEFDHVRKLEDIMLRNEFVKKIGSLYKPDDLKRHTHTANRNGELQYRSKYVQFSNASILIPIPILRFEKFYFYDIPKLLLPGYSASELIFGSDIHNLDTSDHPV
ncbi:hypothetical protein RF11_08001 [Thelohanellus kitauei]|uniref:Uncharacterized protein n=1 Tax=Thelohanellus kitauei TaxID=669202 RepID=A0A0C2NMD1_THEKT|nr:hypothetical protein RF11_08001 [Thelohanellus kitauei]